MQHGDLSNEVVPKAVLVFEGALGAIDRKGQRDFERAIRRHQWAQAADAWTLNHLLMDRIWYATTRLSINLEVVTFAGPEEFGEALKYRLQEEEDLPIRDVWATTVPLLARKIAYMHDLAVIYDPDQSRHLTWGAKGRIITTVDQLGTF